MGDGGRRQTGTEAMLHGGVKVGLTEKRTLGQESTLKLFGGRAFQAEYRKSPVAACAHEGRCGQSSARGSVRKMRSENGERSWREADGTAPHGPLSVL